MTTSSSDTAFRLRRRPRPVAAHRLRVGPTAPQLAKVTFCVRGVASPLLANIALSAIEERYERWVHHRRKIRAHRSSDGITAARAARMTDRLRGKPVFFPIRYADDLVILVSGTREQAEAEKAALGDYLRQSTGLELSEEKTRISDLTEGFEFLGHRVRLKWHRRFGLMPRIEIPKLRQADLRYRVKQVTKRATINRCLSDLLQKLNPILRGWGNFYRFCTGAGQRFASLDHYVGDRLWRWLMKKHGASTGKSRRFGDCRAWSVPPGRSGAKSELSSSSLPVSGSSGSGGVGCRLLRSPWFPESRMHNERCMSGSG